MAEFVIELDDGELLTYSTDPSVLLRGDGSRIDMSKFKMEYCDDYPADQHDTDQIPFSPDNPVVGKITPRLLKIQLGLGCNYSCSYCSQGGQVEEPSSTHDAETFNLDWISETPKEVEFWGGEPLLYWKKIVAISDKVDDKYGPGVKRSIVTNGTLLTIDRIDWLYDHGFSMAISHDGPGQHLRGPDPLDDMEMRGIWRYAFEKMGERCAINSVLTAKNHDLMEIWLWFEERLGTVKLNVEDIVTDYGGVEMGLNDLKAMHESVKKHASSGMALVIPRVRWSVLHFFQTLAIKKPLQGSHQICGMDRKDQIAVDLHGNVLTCQNSGANSGHKIGHISALDDVKLNTSTSFMNRENCSGCPVVHFCYGSCMFLTGKEFQNSCRASYYYNLALLGGAIKLLTGKDVKSVSGWQPEKIRRVIPIKAAA